MTSRISYNVHGNNVPNRQRLLDHLSALQPPAVLVLDNLDLAREIKRLLPATAVIFREYEHGKNVHLEQSAASWLDGHAHQAEGGIALNVLNEPPFNAEVLEWLIELLRLAAPRGIPLIVGNWATGNPEPERWGLAKELLRLLDEHRALFMLGLHEYAGGVITSGLIGGNPTLIDPKTWPQDVANITCWHMGRFRFFLEYCDRIKLRYPRIILTEWGFDDTSDIKPWLEGLRKTHPYQSIRGWRTLTNAWREWFGGLGWSPERAYFEQLKWANETIYAHSPVEAQCIFCWGHSSQDWQQFDVSPAVEFQKMLEEYARQNTGRIQLPTIPTPLFPADHDLRWQPMRLTSRLTVANVRKLPSTQSDALRTFILLEDAQIIPFEALRSDEQFHDPLPRGGFGFWVPVMVAGTRGWVRSDAVIEGVLKVAEEKPPEKPPQLPPPPPIRKLQIEICLPEERAEAIVDAIGAFRAALLEMQDREALKSMQRVLNAFFDVAETLPEVFRDFQLKEVNS